MLQNSVDLKHFIIQADAFFFDLDGTIAQLPVDWFGIKQHFQEYYLHLYGQPLPSTRFFQIFEHVRAAHGSTAVEYFLQYVQDQEIKAVSSKSTPLTWLGSQGLPLIRKLCTQKAKFGLISSNYKATISMVLDQTGLRKYFDAFIGRNNVQKAKPDPEGLLHMVECFLVSKEKCLYCGDDWVDEEAARQAGINFIYVDRMEKLLKDII